MSSCLNPKSPPLTERRIPVLIGTGIPASSSFSALTCSEQDVLELGFEGLPNKPITLRLGMSFRSIERRKAMALRGLGVDTLVEAAHLRQANRPSAFDLIVTAFRDYAFPISIVTPDLRFAAATAPTAVCSGIRKRNSSDGRSLISVTLTTGCLP